MDQDFQARAERVQSLERLAAEITELAGHLNAAQHRWLILIAEFDRRQGWADASSHSCAHWLNWKCGLDMGAAREKVRVAHALEQLPLISAAMARGELSYSKVRAITRVACSGTEAYFLELALHGSAHQMELLVRHFRHAQEAEELSREARQQANRSLTYGYDEDGSVVLKARLPAEVGALVLKALNAAAKEAPKPARGTEDVAAETPLDKLRPPSHERRADALGLIAESFLKHGAEALNGGERHQIIVHVDAETLRDSTAGRCELEPGPALAAETARRLACDASVVAIVENAAGEPLNVGRKTRSIPPALRRALNARDRGCRFPGCTHQRYVDAHHIQHWAQGGETKPSNLVSLCRFHHRQVHEGKVVIQVLDDGAFRFVKPNGQSFDSVAPEHTQPIDWTGLPAQHHARGLHIDPHTAVRRGGDAYLDYDLALSVLCQQAQRAKRVSAETSGERGFTGRQN
jgi:hypothetical protein